MEINFSRCSPIDSDVLSVDAHTLKDLEILESESGGKSLFEFCNFTLTKGGEKVLRQRMQHPWSNAKRISSTQDSLSFISERWPVFRKLPSAYATKRVELYTRGALPMVVQDDWMGFSLGALSLWTNNDRDYMSILYGVQVTCGLIRSLRLFVGQTELNAPEGEITPLIDEMRTLLVSSGLSRIPSKELGGAGFWRILRIDQIFRVHEKVAVVRLLQLIYEIDALIAMAGATDKYGFVMPRIAQGALHVYAQGVVHPFLHDAVANPVRLDQQHRVLFLTGPNMAGKTTYLRSFAIALYLAHLGMGVPASSFSFVPAQCLFSSISLADNLRNGISYFRAEALRVKAIAQAVSQGQRVVALMDEPFKGTNVKDALDASLAILERFSIREDCLFMFSSHLIELSEQMSVTDGQIDYRYFEAEEGEGRLRFDYLLRSGVSSQRLGMRVLREEGVFELLDGSFEVV